ncbi:hypothetical protein Tco_0427995 [Tanacetum coccineum]
MDLGPRPIRSLDIRLDERDIEQVVAEAWIKPVNGSRHDCIVRDKLKNVKEYGKEAMRWKYEAELRDLGDGELKTWMEARRLWIEKDGDKASVLKQKPRIKWDVMGDENSKFFPFSDRCVASDEMSKFSDVKARDLEATLTEKEIREWVSGCGSEKALGRDGFNVRSIKKFRGDI